MEVKKKFFCVRTFSFIGSRNVTKILLHKKIFFFLFFLYGLTRPIDLVSSTDRRKPYSEGSSARLDQLFSDSLYFIYILQVFMRALKLEGLSGNIFRRQMLTMFHDPAAQCNQYFIYDVVVK